MLEPSFADKIWNKGIDIWAGIITGSVTAGIVAVIATITWRWKRKRDLKLEEDKQRQEHRVKQELMIEDAEKRQMAARASLRQDVGELIEELKVVVKTGNKESFTDIWMRWHILLKTDGDVYFSPGNQAIMERFQSVEKKCGDSDSPNVISKRAQLLMDDLKQTDLKDSSS